jgi:hypothetical protein
MVTGTVVEELINLNYAQYAPSNNTALQYPLKEVAGSQ